MDDDDSPPGSPLSSIESVKFDYDNDSEDPEQGSAPIIPLEQQQKIEETLDASYKAALPKFDDAMSISSDSEGEVPLSPASRLDDDDVHEQVTVCRWSHCKAGDQSNMDQLVEHIHNEHIESRGKKYTCEWSDCSRKGLPHASAYALKAHMRSHTREKPFYCTLPECDRAFTRSDALAKHHRTVHETEALRPSDPIPKSMSAAHKNQRLKLNVKETQPEGQLPGPPHANGTTNGHGPLGLPGWTSAYPVELGFTADEEARGPKELFYLLKKEIEWAQEEGGALKKQAEVMEELRKKEWQEKEILLDQSLATEVDWHERRRMVLEGAVSLPASGGINLAALPAGSNAGSPPGRIAPSSPSPMIPSMEKPRNAAEVLAGMRQD
ncbi:hypothetical protein ONS95_004977 [Cadophora gregata]|uniref:uncharacterized protein n=1 Tax=Cadophora gregata TaxID=51156 RepID=UPI0026DBB623|nr:uncharacterized protein ONS95_004977 [Cadophora gregata]KAK0104704.1 hypothetical protein ONS95_004977 [Cadophora gregata]KAK0115211.1 hypothetical protein ONS96_013678 [Cadophora gregata f. sp. sojae]